MQRALLSFICILALIFGIAAPALSASQERRPPTKIEFPEIKDWNSLRITLDRTVCFGTCPSYRVEIRGDGTILYHGDNFTAVKGDRAATISRDAVKALFEKLRQAEFFWLFDTYNASVTDMPSAEVTLSFDDKEKRVHDYAGQMVGMPAVVRDLEQAIDDTAQTKRWVVGPSGK